MNKKIIFLDIDGVLNTGDDMSARHELAKDNNDYSTTRDAYGHHFDERAVRWLSHIVNQTGAEIVVSSTWRKMGDKKIIKMWKDRKLPGTLHGITDDLTMPVKDSKSGLFIAKIRGDEIQAYINSYNITKYVIIDDYRSDQFLANQLRNFVCVDAYIGLNREAADDVISILNKK